MLRRKTIPADLAPAWEAFRAQAERVERARRALLGCLPVGRVARAPVSVGLDLVCDELHDVGLQMHDWRVAALAEQWQRCRDALSEALAAVPAARDVAGRTGELEELLEAVGEVVEPLDAWADAERRWLALRVRA